MSINKMPVKEVLQIEEPKYCIYDGSMATVYTGDDIPPIPNELPIIELTAGIARIKLRNAGLQDAVQTVVDTMGQDVKDQWEYEPYIHSNNALVNAVLKSPPINYTDEQIYQLFSAE